VWKPPHQPLKKARFVASGWTVILGILIDIGSVCGGNILRKKNLSGRLPTARATLFLSLFFNSSLKVSEHRINYRGKTYRGKI